jgi:serine protease Do
MIFRFKPSGGMGACLLLCGLGCWSGMSQAQESAKATAPTSAASAPISSSAQRLYEQARHQLVQVRTLLSGQGSQASVGSGFFVGQEGLILTNYHVVSQLALQPERYRLTYAGVDGKQGALELLAFDAAHDLAVVRPVQKPVPAPIGMVLRPRAEPMNKGEHIYSLGNPLDVGFAVVEGTYNGLVERGFHPTVFFSGSLNPGMSGGPALDGEGRVMGVNVATRLDGQQVSFLVPAPFADELLSRASTSTPVKAAAYAELTRQLTVHQEDMTRRFMAQSWRSAGHARYKVPVPQEVFMRCWGNSSAPDSKGLEFERSECSMNQSVFISNGLYTGNLTTQHEIYDGRKLGPLRFARQYSRSFANEYFGGGTQRTAAQCSERFIESGGLPLRAVLCLSAYKKLPGLYDMGVLVAAISDATTGMQGRFDAKGVSYANALKLAEFYLKGYGWIQTPKAPAEPKPVPLR